MAVVAVRDDQDRVLMMWRYRFVPKRFEWEFPGGIADEGASPADTAVREVEEETGRRPKSVEHVVNYQPMVGMVDSPHDIFVAQGPSSSAHPRASKRPAVLSGFRCRTSPR
ncbi:hypothetical protein ADK46_30345 [Streptomyces rimosus subsp. rimosus]|nr:hypothetical protein ADK46_30345 [Streptomyces rimosus subsp. rimosus]